MGIILGALGGAGDALEKVGARNQEASIKQDQMTLESNLAQQRAESLALFNNKLTVDTANQQRDARNTAITTAQQGIVGRAIDNKYAGSDAAVAAAAGGASPDVSAAPGNDNVQAALTPEQQAVIDQSKAADRSKLMASDETYLQGARQAGYLDPKDVLANDTKQQVASVRAQALQAVQDAKNDVWREKIDFMAKKATDDNNTRMLIAAMRSVNGGNSGDTAKIKTADTYLQTVNAERKAAGTDPMTFEEAFSIANYAPKGSQEDSIRARVATTLINNDPKLVKDPAGLASSVKATMDAIQGVTAPKPAASAPAARPPLSQFLK